MPERPSGRVRPILGPFQAHLRPSTHRARSGRPPAAARRPPPHPLATHSGVARSPPSADGLPPHPAALAARYVAQSSWSASSSAEEVALLASGSLFGSQWSALHDREHRQGIQQVRGRCTHVRWAWFNSHLECALRAHVARRARHGPTARRRAQLPPQSMSLRTTETARRCSAEALSQVTRVPEGRPARSAAARAAWGHSRTSGSPDHLQ